MKYLKHALYALAIGSLTVTQSFADDWTGWMGSNRDSVIHETGYIEKIPESGLKTLWRTPIQGGYSGPAVAKGRVYVTDYVTKSGKNTNNPGGRDKLEGTERLLCLDAATGKEFGSMNTSARITFPTPMVHARLRRSMTIAYTCLGLKEISLACRLRLEK